MKYEKRKYKAGLEKDRKIKVDPVRKIKDLKAISKYLNDNPRNHLLWTIGINSGLRSSDIVIRKVSELSNLELGDTLNIIESKTGKENTITMNKAILDSFNMYLKEISPCEDDYIFKSRKGKNNHISTQAVRVLIKSWTSAINLKGNYGSHTLRKTWGYHQRVTYDRSISVICECYNHSSATITQGYLGIDSKEKHNAKMDIIG